MDVRKQDYFEFCRYKRSYCKKYLLKNIKHDEKKKLISFNINIDHEYFRQQLLPFYQLSLELYEFEIVADGLYDTMRSIHLKQPPFGAMYKAKWELFTLTASHPTYCELRYNLIDEGKYKFAEYKYRFYHSKGGSVVATLYSKLVCLTEKDLKRIQSKRLAKTEKWKKLYIEPTDDTFEFAVPHMVGKNNPRLVFLGNLKQDSDSDRIYCEGLNTLRKNFFNHPYLHGSTDHINSGGTHDILYQFGHLIVRNAFKFDFVGERIRAKYGNNFDVNSVVTVGYFDIDYKGRLELNTVYRVELLDLQCLSDHKYPFIISMKVRIVQHGINTTDVKFKMYPVFARSRL